MKSLLLTIIAMLCLITLSYSQINLLGRTEARVKEILNKDTSFVFGERFNNDGKISLWYDKKHIVPQDYPYENGYRSLLVCFRNDTCKLYEIIDIKPRIMKCIAYLNNNYNKVDDDTWIDKDYSHGYEIKLVEEKFFGLFVRELK